MIGASVLAVVLLPLLLILAPAVKLSSRGPVFFAQKRIGRQGEVFKMLKFRSMVVGADSAKEALRGRTRPRVASSRSMRIRGSRESAGSCVASRWTNSRSC